jgi:3-hydroxyisobutyryl-CoA hydrolase
VQTWADKTIKTIEERSPIGVNVTLKALREGKDWSIAQAFQNELEISSVFMQHPDFVTGVTARLIERLKGRPNWKPNSLKEVNDSDVSPFFGNINRRDQPLQLLNTDPDANYKIYPHAWLALPSEKEIRRVADTENSKEPVIQHFLKATDYKTGVQEKVEEVLDRLELYGK